MTKNMIDISKERGRRTWVKPMAIIFLILMIVLTFFSNTIMNISLAEVSSQQVSAGSITAKVRGTGTVAPAGKYEVSLSEARSVEEVKIAVGDTVNVGDVLFILEESESVELKEAQDLLDDLKREYQQAILGADLSEYTAEKTAIARAEQALADAKKERSAFGTSKMTVSQATEDLRIANIDVNELTSQKNSLENQLALLDEEDSNQAVLKSQLAQIISSLEEVEAKARSAQNIFDNETNIAAADDEVKASAQALEDAKQELVTAVEEINKQSAINNINFTAQQEKIADQEETVAKIQENAVGRELTSKYSGVVTAVSISAGSNTTPDVPVAQIASSEGGYSAEITITKEQAKIVKEGDTAEVTSSSWSEDINATVEAIRSDISEDGASSTDKTVVFKLEGEDLSIGEELNFTLSEKSSNYDLLVPNSAINMDSNGSFVLVITKKSTPLGTRYIAARVDVVVIESDETYTAVSGNLAQYDSIITTASTIVESGDYVRLAESN